MFTIAGVTGHVGGAAADRLLAKGQALRVIVRDAAKAEAWKKRGVEAVVGNLADAAFLESALTGAQGAFLLLPPDFPAGEIYTHQKRVSESIGKAVLASKVPHVVLLSSIGAQHPSGTGPIQGLFHAENHLRAANVKRTFVRAAFFMENLGAFLGAARGAGVYPSFLPPGVASPMVATRDIGELVAEALLAPPQPPTAERIYDLGGPADYTPEDVADLMGAAVGKSVKVSHVPPAAAEAALVQAGVPGFMAAAYAEMYAAMASGLAAFGHGELRRGKLALADVLKSFASASQ
ncbi:MAG: NmrA family NAD(P)-binding protein [Deltaproteobacteria bacterium]|nr:NmrA family NAD(P)-binding protein [Deltaproteobacteria bacterium]